MKDSVLTARPFERLSRLNGYQVERHHADPRGWTVVNAEGRSVGEVKDLIIDTDRMAAAYLDVELDSKSFDLRDDPHVLVPIARAERDGEHRRLRIDGLSRERVTGLVLARDAHQREFWDRWWDDGRAAAASWAPTVSRTGPPHEDLRRTIDTMQPGETVRIPVVNEEIVVERRVVESPQTAPTDSRAAEFNDPRFDSPRAEEPYDTPRRDRPRAL